MLSYLSCRDSASPPLSDEDGVRGHVKVPAGGQFLVTIDGRFRSPLLLRVGSRVVEGWGP